MSRRENWYAGAALGFVVALAVVLAIFGRGRETSDMAAGRIAYEHMKARGEMPWNEMYVGSPEFGDGRKMHVEFCTKTADGTFIQGPTVHLQRPSVSDQWQVVRVTDPPKQQ